MVLINLSFAKLVQEQLKNKPRVSRNGQDHETTQNRRGDVAFSSFYFPMEPINTKKKTQAENLNGRADSLGKL